MCLDAFQNNLAKCKTTCNQLPKMEYLDRICYKQALHHRVRHLRARAFAAGQNDEDYGEDEPVEDETEEREGEPEDYLTDFEG